MTYLNNLVKEMEEYLEGLNKLNNVLNETHYLLVERNLNLSYLLLVLEEKNKTISEEESLKIKTSLDKIKKTLEGKIEAG